MDQDYDYIVLGTGLKECVLSGLLSTQKSTVLHMDRNNYYGAEAASLNLEQLFQRFMGAEAKVPDSFGRTRDYNVDLCPKFIMACGNLVKMLLSTKVTRYLEFKSVAGSFVQRDGKIYKVPATATEALNSSLMGIFEKRRFKGFVDYVNAWDPTNPATHQGKDLTKVTSRELFKWFGLDDNTITFTGHAFALYLDDSYLDRPAREMVERVKLYAYSLARYGNSPYIYPLYGVGGLPEGFSRLCAVYGGTYMLNRPIDEILYDGDGKVTGIKSQGEVARCKKLIADPSYFMGTDKIKKVGSVAHSICILSHPIENSGDADSCQIIIPSREIPNRKNDVYISLVSWQHAVAAKGRYIAHVATNVESGNPHQELIPGLRLLGKIDKEFFWVSDSYAPTSDGSKDNIVISESYDSTSHFETATEDIEQMYIRLTGKALDLSISADLDNQDQ